MGQVQHPRGVWEDRAPHLSGSKRKTPRPPWGGGKGDTGSWRGQQEVASSQVPGVTETKSLLLVFSPSLRPWPQELPLHPPPHHRPLSRPRQPPPHLSLPGLRSSSDSPHQSVLPALFITWLCFPRHVVLYGQPVGLWPRCLIPSRVEFQGLHLSSDSLCSALIGPGHLLFCH